MSTSSTTYGGKKSEEKRAPVETITSFGKSDRIPKTKHWGLMNLLAQGTHRAANRNESFNIPSALSSEKNMMLEQPILQRRVKMLACSQKSTIALLVGGEMYTWGEDDNSIGGDDNEIPITEDAYDHVMWPRRINLMKEVIFVAAGHDHFAALTVETKYNLYTWGKNNAGQLGLGDKQNKKVPRKIISWKTRKKGNADFGNTLSQYVTDDLSDLRLVQVACSYKFTFAVTDNNRVFGWGKNNKGQLGLCRAVIQGNHTMGPESKKRVKAFSELFVLWPVELEEMRALGYNNNTIVNDDKKVKIAQLMISVGSNHASSWMHLEKVNQFSKSYRTEHEQLKKRVQQLETEAIQLRRHAARNGGNGNSTVPKKMHGANSATSSELLESEDHHSTATVETIVNTTRRVTDDPTLNATGRLLSELHNDLLNKQAELLEYTNKIKESLNREALEKKSLSLQESNVKKLWKMVEILEYDCQILNDNKEKEIKKRKDEKKQRKKNKTKKKFHNVPSLDEMKLTELIAAKTREAEDKKILATNGREKLNNDYKSLTQLAEDNVQLEEKRILLQHECTKLKDKVMLLNNLYIGHDKLLRKTYINHNKSDVFDLAKKGRSLYQRIRLSDVAGLASNPNLVEQMTSDLGYQPGVDELIDESNRRLVETMVDAEDYLERRIGVTDARRELADLLKEGLHDMATLRRQNNTYVAGILSQATSKLDVAAYVR